MVPRPARELWESLPTDASPHVVWARDVEGRRVVLLLGAFDPPTNAHLAIAHAASRATAAPAALCMTKVLLARADDQLLTPVERVELLDVIAARCDLGLCFANRGTYLDVGRALSSDWLEPSFVIGTDKLAQLADPSFYDDGGAGVEATFRELDLIVVPRAGSQAASPTTRVLPRSEVFEDEEAASVSATQVRRLVRAGQDVAQLVPPEVALALGGYTRRR